MRFVLLALVCSFIFWQCASSKTGDIDKSELKISFGSCNRQDAPQNYWDAIARKKSDLWVWLGDIIYADTENMSKMKKDYDLLKENPDYARFRTSHDIKGVWDDHDYGINDGGKEYPKKDSSKMLLYDFLDLEYNPNDHAGVYQSYDIVKNSLKVKLILLDVRSFRDSIGNLAGSILGQEQWAWLIGELSASDADVHVIGSGIQILPNEHPYEKWGNFPVERERLVQILSRLEVKNPILLSGDRHLGEMSIDTLPGKTPILEITSSGLTHSYDNFTEEKNLRRVGKVLSEKNFGMLHIVKNGRKIEYTAELFEMNGKSFQKFSSAELGSSRLNKLKS